MGVADIDAWSDELSVWHRYLMSCSGYTSYDCVLAIASRYDAGKGIPYLRTHITTALLIMPARCNGRASEEGGQCHGAEVTEDVHRDRSAVLFYLTIRGLSEDGSST